jgi:hypothetical protein
VSKKKRPPQRLHRKETWLTKERERVIKPWRLAILKLRGQLAEECLSYPAERRRFQRRRLIKNLNSEIGPESATMAYWLFCGSPWRDQLGYEDARKQHYAELKTLGFSPAFQPRGNTERVVDELIFRLDSLASWIEAQESWIFWRALSGQPAAWDRGDTRARQQAMAAYIIARMPTVTAEISDWAIARIVEDFRPWSHFQWVKILKAAARIAERGHESVTELETWVWWRYPIFSRYRWSTAEVCRAATKKFGEIGTPPRSEWERLI